MNLYKITAYAGSSSKLTYFVVADNPYTAEQEVVKFHDWMGYLKVDHCDIETMAKSGDYGKPSVLLIAD